MLKQMAAIAAVAAALPAQALTVGDIAIIGRINTGSPDSFAFVTLADIAAGEVIYFTDNGWTGSAFRGSSATDGDGNENLTKWTASSAVAAGTIVLSTSAGFTTSGSIPGSTSGAFASLALSQTGDQITAFQNSNTSNPLFNTATQTVLFQLDDTGAFENAIDSASGNLAPGVTSGVTGLALSPVTLAGGFSVSASVLGGAAKTKAQWLSTFAVASNWTSGAAVALPAGTIAIAAVPEPGTYAMLLAGLAAVGFVARRR